MPSLPFPDTGTRAVYLPTGAPAVSRAGTLYADSAGAQLAEVYTDDSGVKGALITDSKVITDAHGQQPDYWGPASGQDRLWIRFTGGPLVPVDADYNARIDAALPLAGGTLAGNLDLQSSAAGGANTSDSTRRITLQTYQRAQRTAADTVTPAHFGEAIRIDLMATDAKGMIAWREGYTATALSTGPRSVAWAGAHGLANDGLSWHNHWSVEVPDENGDLQTQLEIPFALWDTPNGYGISAADVYVRSVARFIAGSTLFREGSPGTNRDINFGSTDGSNIGGKDAFRRWSLRINSTAESGSNVGSDFAIWRRSDAGALTGGPALFIQRSTGAIGVNIADATLPAARVDAVESGARPVFRAQLTAAGTVNFAAYDAVLTAVANRYLNFQVSGEASTRLSMFGDGKVEWGDGTNARDTNLYRSAADTLKTDDSFHVGGHLRHLGSSLGFYNTAAVTKQTVTGSRGSNAALASLLTALASLGLLTDSSS